MKLKRILVFLAILVGVVVLGVGVYLGLTSERVTAQRVQRTLDKREKKIEKAFTKVSTLLSGENLALEKFTETFKEDPLLFVFCDDSLVVWTSNLVDPRFLIQRVDIGADTICNMYSGEFLVRSYQVHDYTVYLLSLLSTTYGIENNFLVNEFRAPFFPNSVKVNFNPSDGKYPLYNSSGQVSSRFDIVWQKTPFSPRSYLIYIPILLAIVLVVLALYHYLSRKGRLNRNLFRLGEMTTLSIVFALTAAVLTYIYDKNLQRDDERLMKRIATELNDERDPEFERAFTAFTQRALSDTLFRRIVFSENIVVNDVVSGYAQSLLFDSVMREYEVAMTVCKPDEEILVNSDEIVPCETYFEEIMSLNHAVKVTENLYSVDYATLDPNYMGVMTLEQGDTVETRRLYFEFYKPVTPSGFGLPRILQNANSLIPSNYSVASYRNNVLNYKYGSYIYPNYLSDFYFAENGFSNSRMMKHYTLVDDNKALVVSCQRRGWMPLTAPFAVFFISMMIMYLPFYLIIGRKTDKSAPRKSLRRRFQVMVMLTMLIAFGIVGPVSVFYMLQLHEQKSKAYNFEQTRSILLDLRREMAYGQLTPENNRSDFEMILKQFSNIFFVDLNLYDSDGKLIATSRPEFFDYKLQAPIINAQAFANLNDDKSLFYTQTEYVGKNKFQSNYIAVVNDSGETVAYLNIPFFSTEENISREVTNFSLAYVNIILILIGISAIVVKIVMRKMTEPLALIQNKMEEVKIDRTNEPIEWESNDEIGELVTKYNKLVAKLEESANIIARSERETAWREMARQVAHEIKNPLTPMRLSIQYLQRAWDEQSPDMEKKFKGTTSTLIEQIDTLSEIASAFSNYAKLPEGTPELLDLRQILTKCVDLYNTEENIRFDFVCDENREYPFTADPNNLSRAFGNIIKNAIQAIGKGKPDGHIEIRLRSLPQKYVVTISDNGKGIKEEDKAKIFLPNFTTKSSGMGIGLSIVHNIIQAANGRISFESTENVGTTFIIELFKNDPKN